MIEQIPFVIMAVLLLVVLFVTHIVISGDERDTNDPDKRSTPEE